MGLRTCVFIALIGHILSPVIPILLLVTKSPWPSKQGEQGDLGGCTGGMGIVLRV